MVNDLQQLRLADNLGCCRDGVAAVREEKLAERTTGDLESACKDCSGRPGDHQSDPWSAQDGQVMCSVCVRYVRVFFVQRSKFNLQMP